MLHPASFNRPEAAPGSGTDIEGIGVTGGREYFGVVGYFVPYRLVFTFTAGFLVEVDK